MKNNEKQINILKYIKLKNTIQKYKYYLKK